MVRIEDSYDPVIPEEEESFSPETLDELALNPTAGSQSLIGEGITLTFENADAVGNQGENEIDLAGADSSEIDILADNANGELYIIVDTDSEPFDRDLNADTTFNIELEYETDEDDRFRFEGSSANIPSSPFGEAAGSVSSVNRGASTADEAYPYFAAGEGAITSVSFDFEARNAEFDNTQNETVMISPNGEATVSGTTNIALGSEASIRVSQRGEDAESSLETQSHNISEDGSFEATLDFSDREEGDQATVEFRAEGSAIQTNDGLFGEMAEEPPEPTATPEPMTDEPTEEPTATPEPEGQPGFGAVIALVALLGAALLAARRNAN